MPSDRHQDQLRVALDISADLSIPAVERAEMLMEIAIGLQTRPKGREELEAAIGLYDRGLALCPIEERLLAARMTARKATALQAIPDTDPAFLQAARDAIEAALPTLRELGKVEEVAEAEMNLGVILHSLAGAGRARITDSISAYQRALRTFDRARFPQEFAILQNNIATAFLSIPMSDERGKMREALAVQAFEEGLKVVNLIDHPSEYAMLQNNLGNALQYASSSHSAENNLRALDAYDEALKVRTRETTPIEYANTISNRANCLWNLPDDPDNPAVGNRSNMQNARALYGEAREIFAAHGDSERARIVGEAYVQIERELLASKGADGDVRVEHVH